VDVAHTLVGGGLPATYDMAVAVYEGDEDAFLYALAVEGTGFAALLSGAVLHNWYSLRWGNPGNVIRLRLVHESVTALRGMVWRTILTNPVVIGGLSAYAQGKTWKSIGDRKTGATHYSGAGTMSGGSMPTVESLDDFTWENLRKEFEW